MEDPYEEKTTGSDIGQGLYAICLWRNGIDIHKCYSDKKKNIQIREHWTTDNEGK